MSKLLRSWLQFFFCDKTTLRKSVPTSLSKISWYSSFDGRDVRTTIPSLTWRRLLIAPGHSVRNPENIVQEVVEGLKGQITHHCVWNTHILKVSKSRKKNWNSQFFQKMNETWEKIILRALRIVFSSLSFVFWKNW